MASRSAWASSSRPTDSSQRGDSGSAFRKYHTTSAPIPPITNITRQPNLGMITVPMSPLIGKLETTMADSAPSHLPRARGGTNSVKVEKPTTISAPSPNPMMPQKQDQHIHRWSEGRGDRCETEDGKIGLIREAPAVTVTQKARQERSQHHPEKRDGYKLGVLTDRGEATLERRTKYGRSEVDVKTIEKHSDANQRQDSAMK